MKSKKIVAFVLSLAMAAGSLPAMVLADETDVTEESVPGITEVEETSGEEDDSDAADASDDEESDEQENVTEEEADVFGDGEEAAMSWNEFRTAINNTSSGGSYVLQKDVTKGPYNDYAITIDKSISIYLNGHTIDASSDKDYNMFLIGDNTKEKIDVTISGAHFDNSNEVGHVIGGKNHSVEIKFVDATNANITLKNLDVSGFDVAVNSDSEVILDSCSLTGNEFALGDNYSSYSLSNYKFKGKTIIEDNYHDIYIGDNDAPLDISDITTDSRIGISMQTPGVFTAALSSEDQAKKSCFFPTVSGYFVKLVDSKLSLVSSTIEVDTWKELLDAVADIPADGTINLAGDCIYESGGVVTIASPKDITINLCGHKIDRNSKGRVIEVMSGATLTIMDSSNDEGMITGGKISRSESNYGAGILNHGTLNIQGGQITGNNINSDYNLAQRGAGIYNDRGTVNISGGIIAGNNTDATITDDYQGGGIYNNGTVNINGGTISGNKAYDGGGIYNNGTLIITGGNISNNTATGTTGGAGGGGIYNVGTLTITGGSFEGNSAAEDGGAIYNDATLVITGKNISDRIVFKGNSARIGGAIANEVDYRRDPGTATIKNAIFENNSSRSTGGALNNAHSSLPSGAKYATLTLEDDVFLNNEAATDGGAIYNTGIVNISSSSATPVPDVALNGCGGNTARNGGAIYNAHELNISSWIATRNKAENGGAIYNKADLCIEETNIRSNTATANGGGIYLESDLKIGGKNIIAGNSLVSDDDPTANNVYIGDYKILVTNDPAGSDIGVFYGVDTGKDSHIFTSGYSNANVDDVNYFTSDDPAVRVIKVTDDNNKAELALHTYQPNLINDVSVSLEGDIALNVYFEPADDIDASSSTVTCSGPNGTEVYSLSDLMNADNYTEGYGYKVAYQVFARQYHEKARFAFSIVDTNGNIQKLYYGHSSKEQAVFDNSIEYSVEDYINVVMNHPTEFNEEAVQLIDALKVYCTLACIQFGTGSDDISQLDLNNASREYNTYTDISSSTLSDYKSNPDTIVNSVNDCRFDIEGQTVYQNIEYSGISIVDYSKPSLRLYFKKDIRYADFEVSCSTKAVRGGGFIKWGDYNSKAHGEIPYTTGKLGDLYYIEIPNISFADFDKHFYVHFCSDRYTAKPNRYTYYQIDICPLSYAYKVLGNSKNVDTTIYYVAKSMYLLNQRIDEYNP